jgi:hypothetical protein
MSSLKLQQTILLVTGCVVLYLRFDVAGDAAVANKLQWNRLAENRYKAHVRNIG